MMRTRVFILLAVVGMLIATAFFGPPIPQDDGYHEFVGQNTYLGIPNFGNVASNFPFLLVGVAGIIFLRRENRQLSHNSGSVLAEHRPYFVLFVCIILVFPGSAYYHLAPDNNTLFWDRLPIAMGIMALLAATLLERISLKRADLILGLLVLLGAASVVYWKWSEQQGSGNLNYYIATQFGAILLIVLLVAFFPSRYSRGSDIYVALGWYALAKLAEILDEPIYELGEIITGHELKHLLSALAIYWILRMLMLRESLLSR
jgi:hypothetical protein